MASNINSDAIDALYPVAGQDNDSQGFRDNFSTIKNSLATAKTEITTLQTDSAKLNSDNDFNGNNIQEANLISTTEQTYATGELTSSVNISFDNGHYQIVTIGGDITLTLTDWPASGKLGKLRLELKSDGTGRVLTLNVGSGGSLKLDRGFLLSDSTTQGAMTNPFNLGAQETYIVDFWTHNGGLTVYAKLAGEFI
tara:strand:- start:4121 stop:4708 length:588 start_codon:yes stop_codon:yes gene_type:complete